MAIIVHKYGGTSVANTDRILSLARRVVDLCENGHEPVVIVSALAGETDRLVDLVTQISDQKKRDYDLVLSSGEQISAGLVAMAVQKECERRSVGWSATALLGNQVAVRTNSIHGNANILSVETQKIIALLKSKIIPIITGFQGVDENDHITTLGRGGSDYSAVAIAGALGVPVCEIFTDVEGVFTADPRICSDSIKYSHISSKMMLKLSLNGAKVMQAKSVELAEEKNLVIHVRSSFTYREGTQIVPSSSQMDSSIPFGIAAIAISDTESKVLIVYSEKIDTTSLETARKLISNLPEVRRVNSEGGADEFFCELANVVTFAEKAHKILEKSLSVFLSPEIIVSRKDSADKPRQIKNKQYTLGLIGQSGKMNGVIVERLKNSGRNLILNSTPSREEEVASSLNSDIIIDFSSPEVTESLCRFLLNKRDQPLPALIVGTTGLSDYQKHLLRELGRETTVFLASSFLPSIFAMEEALTKIVGVLTDDDRKTNIVEIHHKLKKDKPSATARSLRYKVASDFPEGIPIVSHRIDEFISQHDVSFETQCGELKLSHQVSNRTVIADNVLDIACWLVDLRHVSREVGVFGMRDFIRKKNSKRAQRA